MSSKYRCCLVFKLLLLKNFKIFFRRGCSAYCAPMLPIIVSFLMLYIFKHLRYPTSVNYTRYFPIQLDEFPPLSLENPADGVQFKGETIALLNRDPLLQFAIREGLIGPLAEVADGGDTLRSLRDTIDGLQKLNDKAQNFQRFKVGFSPRNKELLKVMQDVQQRLNLKQVVDFGSEKEMVDTINDELSLRLGHGVDNAIQMHTLRFLGGVHFKKGRDGWTFTLRFPSDASLTTRVTETGLMENTSTNWWTEYIINPVRTRMGDTLGPQDSKAFAGSPDYYLKGFVALQWSISKALLGRKLEKGEELPLVAAQKFTFPKYMTNNAMPLSQLLSFGFIVLFVDLILVVAHEKECGMKEMLSIMGVSLRMQWLAWWAKAIAICYPVALFVSIVVKFIYGYVSMGIIVILMFCYCTSLIAFAFFVTTWVDSSLTAALIGFGVFMILNLLEQFIHTTTDFIPKLISCFSIPTAFANGFRVLEYSNSQKDNAAFSLIYNPITEDPRFTILHAIVMLLTDTIICIALTRYVENVCPGKFGVKKGPCFYFTGYACKKRCLGKRKELSLKGCQDYGEIELDDYYEVKEGDHSKNVGVAIRNLIKEYGRGCCTSETKRMLAVNDISLNMFDEEIFVLLGHNGAGKTTTMNIITGYYAPTKGNVWVAGLNTKNAMDEIRQHLTYCPQINILFKDLSVKEHLRFFGALQGISKNDLDDEIVKVCTELYMREKMDTRAGQLSGGTKRKLNLAMALIGESKLTILDEPTSGVDVSARHVIWKFIRNKRQDRTIMLSTHFMDEAEALADRIGILAAGQLICCGSVAFLKHKFGLGYHLTVVKGLHCTAENLLPVISAFVPGSYPIRDIPGETTFIIPKGNTKLLPSLFNHLDQNREALDIACYGASMDTMEEVYLHAGEAATLNNDAEDLNQEVSLSQVKNHGRSNGYAGVETHAKKSTLRTTPPPSKTTDMLGITMTKFRQSSNIKVQKSKMLLKHKKLAIQHLRAMFIKRIITSMRSRKVILLTITIPILLNCIAHLLWKFTDDSLQDERSFEFHTDNIGHSLLVPVDGETQPEKSYDSEIQELKNVDKWLCPKAKRDFPDFDGTILSSMDVCVLNHSEVKPPSDDREYDYIEFVNHALGGEFKNIHDKCLGRLFQEDDFQKELQSNQTDSIPYPFNSTTDVCKKYAVLSGSSIRTTPGDASLLLLKSTSNLLEEVAKKKTIARYSSNSPMATLYHNDLNIHALPTSLMLMTNAISKEYEVDVNIRVKNHPLPKTSKTKNQAQVRVGGGLYLQYPIVYGLCYGQYLITPFYIQYAVAERVSGAKQLQILSGVWMFAYWFSNFIWDLLFYHFPAFFVLMILYIFSSRVFIIMGLEKLYVLMLFFGIAQLPFVYATSFIFKNPVMGVLAISSYNVMAQVLPRTAIELIRLLAFESNPKGGVYFAGNATRIFSTLFSPLAYFDGLERMMKYGQKELSCDFETINSSNVAQSIVRNLKGGDTIDDMAFWFGYTYEEMDLVNFLKNDRINTDGVLTIGDIMDFEESKEAICAVYKEGKNLKKVFVGDAILHICCADESSKTDIVSSFLQTGGKGVFDWNACGATLLILTLQGLVGFLALSVIEIKLRNARMEKRICPCKNDELAKDLRKVLCLQTGSKTETKTESASNYFTDSDVERENNLVARYVDALPQIKRGRMGSGTQKGHNDAFQNYNEDVTRTETAQGKQENALDPPIISRSEKWLQDEHDDYEDSDKDAADKVAIGEDDLVDEDARKFELPADEVAIGEDDLVVFNLQKRFKRLTAVEGLSFVVPRGCLFGLLGTNGAGKSTTFKMLIGEIPLTGGNVWFGRRFSFQRDLAAMQSRMGYCPQFDGIIPQMTGRENLVMFSLLRGIPPKYIKRTVEELADEFLLTDHLDRQSGSYSGGNKRKLSVAIALVGKQEVVLLDEPSTGMDPIARRRLWQSLLAVKASGDQSIVLTSHLMEECEVLCDRLCIMVKGKLRCIGTPQHLKAKFAQGYTVHLEYSSVHDAEMYHDDAFAAIKQQYQDARFKDKNHLGAAFTILIPVGDGRSWGNVFEFMESIKEEFGLSDYSVTQTTLTEVFVHLTMKS